MAYTKAKMAAAKARTIEARKETGVTGKIGKTGRMTMQVDQEAYMNAIDMNGGVDDSGKTCWNDSEFRRDMMKRHPEIAVAADKAGATMGPYTGQAAENFAAIFGDRPLDRVVSLKRITTNEGRR